MLLPCRRRNASRATWITSRRGACSFTKPSPWDAYHPLNGAGSSRARAVKGWASIARLPSPTVRWWLGVTLRRLGWPAQVDREFARATRHRRERWPSPRGPHSS
jgi:hypothetical protein